MSERLFASSSTFSEMEEIASRDSILQCRDSQKGMQRSSAFDAQTILGWGRRRSSELKPVRIEVGQERTCELCPCSLDKRHNLFHPSISSYSARGEGKGGTDLSRITSRTLDQAPRQEFPRILNPSHWIQRSTHRRSKFCKSNLISDFLILNFNFFLLSRRVLFN